LKNVLIEKNIILKKNIITILLGLGFRQNFIFLVNWTLFFDPKFDIDINMYYEIKKLKIKAKINNNLIQKCLEFIRNDLFPENEKKEYEF